MNQETRDQLREILCEVPEVEKDNKELRFGTKVLLFGHKNRQVIEEHPNPKSIFVTRYGESTGFLDDEYEIIGNSLQERHLRMYCDYINLYLIITTTGMISYIKKDNEMINTGIKLDNTKELEDQSEETGQKLIKFLLDNK